MQLAPARYGPPRLFHCLKPPQALASKANLKTLFGAVSVVGQNISHYKIIEKIGQGGMVEVFLARTVPGDDESTEGVGASADGAASQGPPSGSMEIDPEALFGAAAKMPPLARAAIWLVVFRRWSYGEVSSVLGTDVEGLKDLLQYRQVLVTAVVRRTLDRSGTDDERRH